MNCYTDTNVTDYWWFEKQQNKPNYYKGKIEVLMNGGCFSTTGHLLALMREYKIGKFYGEYSQEATTATLADRHLCCLILKHWFGYQLLSIK